MALESQIENRETRVNRPPSTIDAGGLQLGAKEFASLRPESPLGNEFAPDAAFKFDDTEAPNLGKPDALNEENPDVRDNADPDAPDNENPNAPDDDDPNAPDDDPNAPDDDPNAPDDDPNAPDEVAEVPSDLGDPNQMSPENKEKLETLKEAGRKASDAPDASTASLLKALTEEANRLGSNPDGSPKVAILAAQTADGNPTTSFYASFAANAAVHQYYGEMLAKSRQIGFNHFSPNTLGLIVNVQGGSATRG